MRPSIENHKNDSKKTKNSLSPSWLYLDLPLWTARIRRRRIINRRIFSGRIGRWGTLDGWLDGCALWSIAYTRIVGFWLSDIGRDEQKERSISLTLCNMIMISAILPPCPGQVVPFIGFHSSWHWPYLQQVEAPQSDEVSCLKKMFSLSENAAIKYLLIFLPLLC